MTSAIKVKPETGNKMWKHRVWGSGPQTRTGQAKLGSVASAASHLARLLPPYSTINEKWSATSPIFN